MLKKLTKGLSLLLALCMLVALLPVGAMATDSEEEALIVEAAKDETSTPAEDEEEPSVGDGASEEGSDVGSEEGTASGEGGVGEESDAAESDAEEIDGDEEIADAGIMPLALSTDYSAEVQSTSSDTFYKIVHLDCGRKYFSPENIKKIIDNAAAAGFNQVELYLSDNQGFRFALDDMNLTTSTGNTYDLAPALGDGYSDGSKYPDGSGKYLTQSEMNDIITYAKGKGIDIVPCINVPGHMGAILEEFTQFKYSGSNSSIDLENTEAVAFALAITEKYATYFESQGVKFYNLGADEYANDLSTMGFQGLYTSGKYQKFVDFLNSAAQIVINHNMTPRAFNDGIYYNEDNTYSINSAIQVCYWSCGWSGYNLASAQYIVNQGMDVINTHGDYYWVLGRSDWQCSADKASQFDYTSFQYRTGTTGNGTISDPAGAMFCIWCDVGNANGTDGGTAIVSATADVIAAFGAALPASETGGESGGGETGGGDNGETGGGNTDDVKVTENVTVTLTVGGSDTKTISGYNFAGTYTTEDPSIATVEVTGTDATEATTTYTQASVTCNKLISSNSNNWTAVSGYYYTPDGTNYYPLYAKRSSENILFWTRYTYTWGYSTTSSTSNVTQIGTQSTTDTSTTPNIAVYTQSTTEGTPASTTVTFTAAADAAGKTTYVTVGNTRYTIVVKHKEKSVTAIVGEPTTVENVSGTLDASELDTGIATVSIDNGTMTVTGVAAGTTSVIVGDTKYNITVTKEDLSQVTGLTVEFWITNRQVTANGDTSMTIAASASGVHSESGALFSDLVPATGTQDSNTMVFWKGTRLASDNKQTTGSGVNKTNSGTDFAYIRYWNGSWAYSSDGKDWTNVASGDQIVAYYLQKTEVTDEVTTEVVDWGVIPSTSYNSSNFVLLDFAVKYESGELTPSSFPVSGKTMAFHCDPSDTTTVHQYNNGSSSTWSDNYRDIGMIKAEETADYEVYMITVTPTNDSRTTQVAGNANTATSYTYGGTEKVVWVDDEANLGDFADESLHYTSISGDIAYSVGGEPIVPGLEIFNRHGMLVTYYVRAKVTEDSLSVHYIDQTANQEFYSYNIAVKSGTLFNENIGLADPWKGNLANGSVTNLQNKTQTVSANLSTMPAIGAQYRYSEYTCVKVERSENGKDVYLYYTFNNAHSFVVDFSLPLKISTGDLGISGDWTSASVSGAQYGTATATIGEGLTYTPTKMLQGVETLQLTLTDSTGSVTHQIYIYPATTVYYEEGFAELNGFSGGSKGAGTQATQVAGKSSDEYGYDEAYKTTYGKDGWTGTQATSNAKGDKAEFTFTGTGVDIYTNSTTGTGWVMIKVANSASTVKLLQVNTALLNGKTGATAGQEVDGYNVPVASISGLAHGSYTVTITHTDTGIVNLDGFRVYGTLATEPDFYKDDLEDKPTFIELRDQVLAALGAQSDGTSSEQYAGQIARNIYSQVYASGSVDGAVIIDNSGYTKDQLTDLLDNGPKNELYLRSGQSVVFKVKTNRQVQIGLKALDEATNYTINGTAKTLSTSTDMFYTVLKKTETESAQTVTITNNGTGILSITKLKICDDPNVTLGALTEEDLVEALVALGYEKAPTEPEVTYADATLTIKVNNASTVLTTNGVVGEKATFTAADIQAAAEGLVAEGYVLDDAKFSDVKVAYGESDELTFTASEEVVEPAPEPDPAPDPKPEQPPQNIWQKLNNFLKKLFWWL